MNSPIVLAITGASGAPYAVRLLEVLARQRVPVWLTVSTHGMRLLKEECGLADMAALARATGGDWTSVREFHDGDRGALPASGSQETAGMVICPCSMGTVSAIAQGSSRSLVERAADVTLKERRRLVLVPRETPLNQIQIENLLRVARAGADVVPAMPAFYDRPKSFEDLADFIAGRVLSLLKIPHSLFEPWPECQD